ncbi:MAG: hypothetical protein AAF462_07740 [Thermodesulfobacteriota bacterium]
MARSTDEQFLHDWVIRKVHEKYSRDYSKVHINPGDEKNFEYNGEYPDIVFENYEQIVMIAEVETNETINEQRAEKWKKLSELGAKLTLVVPKNMQNPARDICWKAGLVAKVNIGSFDVNLSL